MSFVVLTKNNCILCKDVQNLLENNQINFKLHNVDTKEELFRLCGKRVPGWPQLLRDDGTHFGSIDELEEYIDNREVVLAENPYRFTTFPIVYDDLWKLYKRAQASFWVPEEIDFSKDTDDWESLNANEQHFIKHILAFFAGSDGIVNENLASNFMEEVQLSEAKSFYSYQMYNESIHSETYSLLIDKYVKDTVEKTNLFRAIETIPSVKAKADWAFKWFNRDRPFAERLIAFACVEGILFSGSFCAIFWLKKRGLMPGLGFSNEYISRDEALHMEFAVALYKYMKAKPSADVVRNIVREAVETEKDFIIDALPCSLIGMNSNLMKQYIEYVADRLLKQLNVTTIYDVENPFDFMENISLQAKTNFFEKRVAEYAHAGIMVDSIDQVFGTDADF